MAEDTPNPAVPPILAGPEIQPAHYVFPSSESASNHSDKLALGITTLLALLVYLFTLAPEVTLGDSGVLATSGAYAGVPGPPAYPAWVIYSWFFTKLIPFSNLAWRIAFGSACASAVACGLVAQIISFTGNQLLAAWPKYSRLEAKDRQMLRVTCGCIAGLCLAFSSTVWREAIIVSTWSFGLLLFAAILWFFTRCCFGARRVRSLYAALFLFGVLLTNNPEMLVALPGFICLLLLRDPSLGRDMGICTLLLAALLMCNSSMHVFPEFDLTLENWPLTGSFAAGFLIILVTTFFTRSSRVLWKPALIGCLCLTCGWLFCFYPVIASMSTPPVNWGYLRNFDTFWWPLSRGHYEKCGCILTVHDYLRQIQQMFVMLKMTGSDFGWLGSVLALVPLCLLRQPTQLARRWLLGLVAIEICVFLALVGMLNPYDADRQSWSFMQAHFGPALTVVAIFMGIGLMQVGAMVARPTNRLSA